VTADLLAALAEQPAGLPTAAVARRLRRRRAAVLDALEAAERRGLVERLPPAGQAHARRWRLRTAVETPLGTAREQRQATGAAPADTKAVPELARRTKTPDAPDVFGLLNEWRRRLDMLAAGVGELDAAGLLTGRTGRELGLRLRGDLANAEQLEHAVRHRTRGA
jgi:hypothetical protein